MTTILGCACKGCVYMGGDSLFGNGWTKNIKVGRKVWKHGSMLLGGAGIHRAIQVVQYELVLPRHEDAVDNETYLVRLVVPAIRKALKNADAQMKQDSDYTNLLIGYRGELYRMDSEFSVVSSVSGIQAVGSGGDFAQGAFEALRSQNVPIKDAMIQALEIAGQHDVYTGAPYYVESAS